MDRSTVLNVLLSVLALSLFLGALALPPERPPNQVEYRVESFDAPQSEPLEYENLTEAEREMFDTARNASSGTHTVPQDASPAELTPPPGGIDHYAVRAGNETYLLQVTHYNDTGDPLGEILPWLGALVLSVLLGAIAAYRQFT